MNSFAVISEVLLPLESMCTQEAAVTVRAVIHFATFRMFSDYVSAQVVRSVRRIVASGYEAVETKSGNIHVSNCVMKEDTR